jgi:cell division protein FtsL
MNNRTAFALLLTMVLGSALTVIYVKHQSRVLFADLRSVQKQQDQQVIQWGRLQLQNTTLAAHSNVEARARKDLKMHLPENIELVRLQ